MLNKRKFVAGAGALTLAGCATPATPTAAWRTLPTENYGRKQDDIFFTSARTGWYGNGAGKLFRTQDGGESWQKIWEQPTTFVRALGFIDEQNGFLGNLGAGYVPNITDPHPLCRTADGGVTWTPINADGIDIVKGICAIDILPRRIIYQGEMRTTHIITAAGRAGGTATMLRSMDSGTTWRVIDLRQHAGMILDVKFLDQNLGFACAATSDDLEQSNAAILRTTDGGETWTRVYQSARKFELCWKMSWPSARVSYATVQHDGDPAGEAHRFVAKTIDGGASWRELPLANDASVREFGIGFLNERQGWVGAANTGYQTDDGGRSWRPVEIGRAVNKIRILRDGRRFTAFAIGVNVSRLDGEAAD